MRQNVLQLIGSFEQGGSERQAVQLTRLLHERASFSVSVACLDSRGVLREEVERLGLGEIGEYPLTSFYDRNMLVQVRRFAGYLRQHDISILHTHDFYTNIFGMLAGTLARVPVLIASKRETGGMRTRLQKLVEKNAYRLADAIVGNAGAVREWLILEGVPARKISVIYNGLDAGRLRADSRLGRSERLEMLGLPAGRRFVTIVANLRHAVKDHPTFLRAAARVRSQVPDAAFVLAGEGELIEPLRTMAGSLGIGPDVFFPGRCSKVAELLAVSDVCVLSSVAEGFSNAILEYMAAARPVVATDVGGAREAILEGETGFTVPPGDDSAMARRIAELLADRELARRMGEEGRRVVERDFSCEAQLDRTESLYRRMLELKLKSGARVVALGGENV